MKHLLFGLLLLGASASAGESHRVLCTSSGKSGGNDAGQFMVKAELAINIHYSTEKQVYLLDAAGNIKVASAYEEVESPDKLNEENSYIGIFRLKGLEQNLKYRPRRYKNHIQFRDFDAAETKGYESGMWGQFVIHESFSSDRTRSLSAHYIFQAGDHMGGTIHFLCRRQ